MRVAAASPVRTPPRRPPGGIREAAVQVDCVAAARHVAPSAVQRYVAAATHGRDLGFIGAPYVNVVQLNLSLDQNVR
jgi:K+-transporting ATPase c subunit